MYLLGPVQVLSINGAAFLIYIKQATCDKLAKIPAQFALEML